MRVGASYYPELSDRETWEKDLSIARGIGLSMLRCGEFSWSRLAPDSSRWETSWMEEFLSLAEKLAFSVIWCTPSATPPPYLFDRWPDLTAVNEHNLPVPVGVRRNYCPSHEGYRDLCAETATRLAAEFGRHPAIAGWQVDNELAGDGFTCWCPRCQREFQAWLQKRYETLDHLAAAWKPDVWAQRYSRWEQIPIPHRAFAGSHSPALKLAWRRFRSDNWLAFYRVQADALRTAGITQPITTNFYNLNWDVPFDRWAWRPHLDVTGISHYFEDEVASRFELALLRGLDHKPLWVLEQKAGQQNAQNYYPEDMGRLERHLRICVEEGAAYGVYWHLRQHQAGCEMEHGAVLRHDGAPTRVAYGIRDGISACEAVSAKPASFTRALVFDFHQHWAQETRPQPGAPWDYRCVLEQEWFGALREIWPEVAIGAPAEALAKADVIFAPHGQMRDEDAALPEFFARGGIFVTTADYGRLDQENNVWAHPPLEAFSSLISVPKGEMLHLKPGFSVGGLFQEQVLSGARFWFVPEDAAMNAHLSHEEMAGPAFLEWPVGKGRLIVLLSAFDRSSLAGLLTRLLA